MPEENVETQNTETENKPTEKTKLSYEELEAELRNVRNEAASRRIANRELEEKAKQWEEYQDSQKTELEKLQERLNKQDQDLAGYRMNDLKVSVAKEFGLDSEDAELLTGSDEATIRKQAEKLKARFGKSETNTPRPADLLAGNRGTPVGGNNSNSVDEMIRRMANGR